MPETHHFSVENMKISIIAAIGANYAIGKDNDLIWSLPDDMNFFKKKTSGHTVIMGRLNYESIPKKWRPLPNRRNIILTTNPEYQEEGVDIFHQMSEAIESARKAGEEELFIIGGGQIYQLGLEYADTMYLTEIKAEFTADVFFPTYDKADWQEVERIPHQVDEKHAYPFDFVTYIREKDN